MSDRSLVGPRQLVARPKAGMDRCGQPSRFTTVAMAIV